MQDALDRASNEHRSLFYSSQLKVLDISQNIRVLGPKFTDNEFKNATLETFNHFCMLEKIFQEERLPHIYQLVKVIAQNYNSIISILLEKQTKFSQIRPSRISAIQKHQEGQEAKAEEGIPSCTNLLREIKKNRLGGIHLFNENYARYLEDRRILDQIKFQKGKRLHRNRLQLLRESIFEELNHKTDVEEFPAKNDEITNYILKSKDKSSIYNYVSYEPELQEILAFFQNTQNEANDFLVRRVGKISQEQGIFSFADFQREILLKNSDFKRQMLQKFKEFVERYKKKQAEIQNYVKQKQQYFKKLQDKYQKKQEYSTQTQMNFEEFVKNWEEKLRNMELKCQALENIRKEQFYNQKEGQLYHELAVRQNQIQKLNFKISQQESAISYVKKLLKEEKTKKSYSVKEENQKSQKNSQENNDKEKWSNAEAKQVNQHMFDDLSSNDEALNITSNNQLRKQSYLSNTWRRKQSAEGTPLMSYNQLEKESRELAASQRTERKKLVRYNLQSKEEMIKNQSYYGKQKSVESSNCFAQTEYFFEGNIDIRDTQEKIDNDQPLLQSFETEKESRKEKRIPSSTPKIPSKNGEFNVNKNSSQRLLDTSKKLKQRNNITSLSKIKSQQDSVFVEPETRVKSKQKPAKRASKNQSLKPVKQQNQQKKAQVKNNQPQPTKQSKQSSNESIHLSETKKQKNQAPKVQDTGIKNADKKDTISYKIFDVMEETDQQRQTIRNTERSLKNPSIYSRKKLQNELVEKINKQLAKPLEKKSCSMQKAYNITIFPHQESRIFPHQECTIFPHQESKPEKNEEPQRKIEEGCDEKVNRKSVEAKQQRLLEVNGPNKKKSMNFLNNNQQAVEPSKDKSKDASHVQPYISPSVLLIDDLIKNAKPQHQIKKEKLKNWKKKLVSNIKSDTMTEQEALQILLIVSESTREKENSFSYYNAFTPISSVPYNNRNSLPDLEEPIDENKPKKQNGRLRRIKFRTSCCEQEIIQAAEIKIDRQIQDNVISEYQQKIEDLIRHDVLHPNFKEKFHSLHKQCREEFICSHINKYFETIMKYYEERKKKGKQCLVLPIQHIGYLQQVQLNNEKQVKQHAKKVEFSSGKDQYKKQNSSSKGKVQMAIRHRLSQESILPTIKDSKVLPPKASKIFH